MREIVCNEIPINSVPLENGNGMFQRQVKYKTGTLPVSIVTADFNNDKSLDLATTNCYGRDISVLLGNRNRTFQRQREHSTRIDALFMTAGGFNNDDNLNLAVVSYSEYLLLMLID